MRILCWLKGIWRTLQRPGVLVDGIPIDGCDYVEKEAHENCKVTICECEKCGKVNISWER